MSDNPWAEKPETIYKSAARRAELPWWARNDYSGRDMKGRFIARWSGAVCDRIGCDDPIERRGARFCATHRQEHGRRLLAQLQATVEEFRARSAR